MIQRASRFGNLVFDRSALVRAALRTYVEAIFNRIPNRRLPLSLSNCDYPNWTGDLKIGAFYSGDLEGNQNVLAWTDAGVVGLAYEHGFGPLQHLDLSPDAVTGGPEDVRGAVPDLPAELEPAFAMASALLDPGSQGEKLAGIGIWLYGDEIGGSFFTDRIGPGADQLARWGKLQGGRLLSSSAFSRYPSRREDFAEAECRAAPANALLDAVVDRRMAGPTEFTPEEIEMIFRAPPDPKELLPAQRSLAKVGITWPGSPELPPEPPRPIGPNPFRPRLPTAEEMNANKS